MIETAEQLNSYLETIRSATWVAVDTEADSLHAYPEKVCLIQISTAKSDRLIDPLAGFPIDRLLEMLSSHELIMHGADYDLRLLRKHHEFVPRTIFDTMLAARLLGIEQFGLSHLVEFCLKVKLEKGPQKANWAIRPLTKRMEVYARNDTHYLKALSDRLRQELEGKGRLAWHQESCARLILDCAQERVVDSDAVWRVKGSHQLGRLGMAVLREIWLWRETEAVAANRPPFFVLSHDTLVAIAQSVVEEKPVESMFPRHLSDRRRGGLLRAIEQARQLPPEQHPRIRKTLSRRPSETERRRYAELQKVRDKRAAELGIDPTLIASRSVISDLVHDWEKHLPDLMEWQRKLLTE